ncbi:unnamed protein product [Pedinophyceae sp. YPF-701]|nr:unnamed protein product [Pedinophyceae sp. YPF-701]
MAVLLSLMRTAGTLGDRPLRRMALLAHFVPSFIPEPALVDQSTIGTLAGPGSWLRPAVALPRTVPLTAANLVTVNAAPLTHAAQRASDGVVYVIDEPVLTPGRGLPTSESATRGPLTGPCRDLLAAVKSQCESQKCGSCHPAMCAAGGAIACHFRRVRTAGADRRGRTFRELTSGYGVCRKPCPTMRESLAILRRRDLIEESTTFEALRFYRNASEGARSEGAPRTQRALAAPRGLAHAVCGQAGDSHEKRETVRDAARIASRDGIQRRYLFAFVFR